MAQVELIYNADARPAADFGVRYIPSHIVDLILTYDPSQGNADNSYTATAATGTYTVLNSDGTVNHVDQITNIVGNESPINNHIRVGTQPYVNADGLYFHISNAVDTQNLDGSVGFYNNGGAYQERTGAVVTSVQEVLPSPATFSIADAQTVTEGGQLVFTVTRSGDTGTSQLVAVTTGDGTAIAGQDYTARSQTLTFGVGVTSLTFAVQTTDDALYEGATPETVRATLSSASSGSSISTNNGTAIGRINDNDAAPSFALSPASIGLAEGNAGTTSYTYTVTRTGDAQAAQTVAYAVAGTGANPANAADFAGNALPTGTLSFAQGQTSQTITVQVAGDTTVEADEGFTLTLSNPNFGTITQGSATGTILNDDATTPTPPSSPAPAPTPVPAGAAQTGTAGPDLITGGTGADTLQGLAGNDTISGLQGNDLILGNQGDDVLFGNQGRDTLFGGQGQDTLFGGQDQDVLFGNLGNDVLSGNLGNDTLYGGQGADSLYGGQGNDVLFGDLGNDVLSGDLGNDVLVGGAGADRYVFNVNSGNDAVLGFNAAEGDRLDLRGQTYTFGTAADGSGSALLVLSGGGTIELAGITQAQVNTGFFTA